MLKPANCVICLKSRRRCSNQACFSWILLLKLSRDSRNWGGGQCSETRTSQLSLRRSHLFTYWRGSSCQNNEFMVEIREESLFLSSIISQWYHWALEEGRSYLYCHSDISWDLGAEEVLGQVEQSLLSDNEILWEVRFPEKSLQVSAQLQQHRTVGFKYKYNY